MKPTLSKAAQQLREQFDDTFPDRDRRSDGWIGDPRHASRPSDHTTAKCKVCSKDAIRLISAPTIGLDAISGDFPRCNG